LVAVRRKRMLYKPVRTLALLPLRSPARYVIAIPVDVDPGEQRSPKLSRVVCTG
jgi:hypothetical protein